MRQKKASGVDITCQQPSMYSLTLLAPTPPESKKTKQDVQPVWNRVPCRTAGSRLVMKPHIHKYYSSRTNKYMMSEPPVTRKLFKMCPLVLLTMLERIVWIWRLSFDANDRILLFFYLFTFGWEAFLVKHVRIRTMPVAAASSSSYNNHEWRYKSLHEGALFHFFLSHVLMGKKTPKQTKNHPILRWSHTQTHKKGSRQSDT